ncbi:MAG: hypothetical protein ACKVQC_07575 [Elusimicrobiota bacterium]
MTLSFSFISLHARWGDDEEVEVSTLPIGSNFYRHLAQEFNLNLHHLVKFEKSGVGRSEMISLILISTGSGKSLQNLGKDRYKSKKTLKQLAEENSLRYVDIYQNAVNIKKVIEAKGDLDLPPPVFETDQIKEGEKKQTLDEPLPPTKKTELD